jgi:hypothetical protein
MSSYTHRDVDIAIEKDGYSVLRGFASAVRINSRAQKHRYRRVDEGFTRSKLLATDFIVAFTEPFWDDDFDEMLTTDEECDIKITCNKDAGGTFTRTYKACKPEDTVLADGEPSFQRSVTFICQSYE